MSQYKSIGITGSRRGINDWQKLWLQSWFKKNSATVVHHGDCVGADDEVATIFSEHGSYIIAHPGDSPALRANCSANDLSMTPLPFLVRDRLIVKKSQLIIGFPDTYRPTPHSGTWYTLDYATKHAVPTLTIKPDGVAQANEHFIDALEKEKEKND